MAWLSLLSLASLAQLVKMYLEPCLASSFLFALKYSLKLVQLSIPLLSFAQLSFSSRKRSLLRHALALLLVKLGSAQINLAKLSDEV